MAVLPAPHIPSASGWRWALGGVLLGGLVALVLYAPAHWLATALTRATGDRLQLVNARGTLWNGSAGVVLSSGARGAEAISLPGTLSWTLRPAWGAVDATLTLPCCAPQP